MKRLFLLCVAAWIAPGLAAAAPIASGAYDNTLLVAVDPATGVLSGYFDMTEVRQVSFSCIFYIKGKQGGGAVDTFDIADRKGDLIRGALTPTGRGKLQLVLPEDHGGCANLQSFTDKTAPVDFELQTARPWTAVRVVKADKAYFYPTPDAAAHGRAYIVKDDGVGQLATKPGWVQAEFTGGAHVIAGWLRAADLYSTP
ncbi:MAG TPA: hypothetical protein VGI95_09270 [Caulobacteraceae bacterium]|jgi:hypothetical protein